MREIHYQHEPGALPPSLEKVSFLRGLDGDTIDGLLSQSVLLECNPGDTIISQGDDSKFFCILLKGAVKILKDGKQVNEVSDSGTMIGELALVTDSTRNASVVASKHTFCLKVEPGFLDGLDDAGRNGFYARLYQFVSKLLGERLEEGSEKIAELEAKLKALGVGNASPDEEPDVYRL